MDMPVISHDVLTTKEGLAGRLRLNRPKALHSLNRQMVRDMANALIEWRDDPDVRIILIDHAEGRGFCAGGDVVGISQDVEGHEAAARAFFFCADVFASESALRSFLMSVSRSWTRPLRFW